MWAWRGRDRGRSDAAAASDQLAEPSAEPARRRLPIRHSSGNRSRQRLRIALQTLQSDSLLLARCLTGVLGPRPVAYSTRAAYLVGPTLCTLSRRAYLGPIQ